MAEGNLIYFVAAGIAYAKSKRETAVEFGEFAGRFGSPSRAKDKGKGRGRVDDLHPHPARIRLTAGPDGLETDRLVLRRRRVEEAAVYRRLWLEVSGGGAGGGG